jgi:lysophospholipase L1-like esterase
MIGLDGIRPDALLAAKTPNIDLLAAHGVLKLDGRTTSVTSSGPAWTTILTGARMKQHQVWDNAFEGKQTEVWPTWLQRLETARPESFTVAISQWGPIHEQLTNGHVDHSVDAEDGTAVAAEAVKVLRDTEKDVTAMFLHFDGGDHAGHEYGYGPDIPQYLAAIEKVDEEIGKVLAALRARPNLMFEDWLIMVGTDHGGLGTSHGSDVPECRTVFLLASGTGATGHVWRESAEVTDFATVALRHLGLHGTTIPAARADGWWLGRHQAINKNAVKGGARIAFVGDSITQGWEGAGAKVWTEFYAPYQAINLGIGGDRTEHVLYRLRNGNLKNQAPEVAVVMIGTNNSGANTSEEIALGVQAIVAELLTTLPETKVLLLATFPRGADDNNKLRKVNQTSNGLLQIWSEDFPRVHYLDINAAMLSKDGTLSKGIMPDLLHPNTKGYQIWADAMAPKLEELLSAQK